MEHYKLTSKIEYRLVNWMKKPKEKTLNLTWITKLLNEDLLSRQGKAEVGDRIIVDLLKTEFADLNNMRTRASILWKNQMPYIYLNPDRFIDWLNLIKRVKPFQEVTKFRTINPKSLTQSMFNEIVVLYNSSKK